MRWVRRVLVAACFVALLVGGWRFASENSQTVSVHYLVGSLEGVAVWRALLAAFALGAVASAAIGLLRGFRLRLESRRYRKAARELESEVHQLRTLPLAARDEADPGSEAEPLLEGLERGS